MGEIRTESIERKSWILAVLFTVAALPFRDLAIVTGIVVGALLAILNFRWLRNFALAMIADGRRPSPVRILLYLLKYVFTGLVILSTIVYDLSDSIAIMVGVSVVFLAICWEGMASKGTEGEETNHATEL